MNQEIFSKLQYESGLIAQGCWDQLDGYDQEAICRFGDLIVLECARVAREHILRSSGVDPITYTGVALTEQRIREHFGLDNK